MNLDFLMDHPYIGNAIFVLVAMAIVIYRKSNFTLLAVLFTYSTFHFWFGLLPSVFPQYKIPYYLDYRLGSSPVIRGIGIFFLVFIWLQVGIQLYRNRFHMPRSWRRPAQIFGALVLTWIVSTLIYWDTYPSDFYSNKFLLMKGTLIITFVSLVAFFKTWNPEEKTQIEEKMTNLGLLLSASVLLLVCIEFYMMNANNMAKCIFFGDHTCVYRPTSTLFNPNNLAIWFAFTGMGFSYVFLNQKFMARATAGLLISTAGLFSAGSRSTVLAFLLFSFLMFSLLLWKRRDLLIPYLQKSLVFAISFVALCVTPAYLSPNGAITNAWAVTSERYIYASNVITSHWIPKIVAFSEKSNFFKLSQESRTWLFETVVNPRRNKDSSPESTSIAGRMSLESTDNTFLYQFAAEGLVSLLAWLILFLYPIVFGLRQYRTEGRLTDAFLFATTFTILMIGLVCNWYAAFPNWMLLVAIYAWNFNELHREKIAQEI